MTSASVPAPEADAGRETLVPDDVSSLGSTVGLRDGVCVPVVRAGTGTGSDFLKNFEKAPNMCSELA